MPQDLKYILKSSALLSKEAERFLNEDVASSFISLKVSQIDRFLVDGRRQIRLWKKDVVSYELEIVKMERDHKKWSSNLELAEKNAQSSLIKESKERLSRTQLVLDHAKKGFDGASQCIHALQSLLEQLEDKVQDLRQVTSSQASAQNGLKVSDIIAEE